MDHVPSPVPVSFHLRPNPQLFSRVVLEWFGQARTCGGLGRIDLELAISVHGAAMQMVTDVMLVEFALLLDQHVAHEPLNRIPARGPTHRGNIGRCRRNVVEMTRQSLLIFRRRDGDLKSGTASLVASGVGASTGALSVVEGTIPPLGVPCAIPRPDLGAKQRYVFVPCSFTAPWNRVTASLAVAFTSAVISLKP